MNRLSLSSSCHGILLCRTRILPRCRMSGARLQYSHAGLSGHQRAGHRPPFAWEIGDHGGRSPTLHLLAGCYRYFSRHGMHFHYCSCTKVSTNTLVSPPSGNAIDRLGHLEKYKDNDFSNRFVAAVCKHLGALALCSWYLATIRFDDNDYYRPRRAFSWRTAEIESRQAAPVGYGQRLVSDHEERIATASVPRSVRAEWRENKCNSSIFPAGPCCRSLQLEPSTA